MKKLFTAFMAFALAFSLVACGSKESTNETPTPDNSKTEQSEEIKTENKLESGTKIELTVDNYLDYMEWKDFEREVSGGVVGTKQLVIKPEYYWDQEDVVELGDGNYYTVYFELAGNQTDPTNDPSYTVFHFTAVYKDGHGEPYTTNTHYGVPVFYDANGEYADPFGFLIYSHTANSWWDADYTEDAYNAAYQAKFGHAPSGYEVHTPFKVIDVKGVLTVK